MHWQADADGVFRCPTAGCFKYWKATRPLPVELKFPMLHTANGRPKCPGCALVYRSNASLYSHYADQSRRGDMRHPGRVCAAVPKNLLSSNQQEELRRHWQVASRLQSARSAGVLCFFLLLSLWLPLQLAHSVQVPTWDCSLHGRRVPVVIK